MSTTRLESDVRLEALEERVDRLEKRTWHLQRMGPRPDVPVEPQFTDLDKLIADAAEKYHKEAQAQTEPPWTSLSKLTAAAKEAKETLG